MATISITRRTGTLICGVVPPGGAPLPQQTVGIGVWIGNSAELRDPSLRAELLRLSQIRRELRSGHLAKAARIALEIDVPSLPDDPGTKRTVAVLRSVGVGTTHPPVLDAENILHESLNLLGGAIPHALLDLLLDPTSCLAPEVVERVCINHDSSASTLARIRILLVRRAARDILASESPNAFSVLEKRIEQATSTPMHGLFRKWLVAVRNSMHDPRQLSRLIEAVGPNLPLTDQRNRELHEALIGCFECRDLDRKTQHRFVRMTFSAWSTLLDIEEGYGSAELTSFSAQAAAFRQVFELLMSQFVLQRFLRSPKGKISTGLLDAVRAGTATLGIGRWYGLLFSSKQGKDRLSRALRDWFKKDPDMARLRKSHHLKSDLSDLLQIRLHALPHDEESARLTSANVLETVARVGFGATGISSLPRRNEGLVGRLCGVGK